MNTAQNKTAVTGERTAARVEDLIDELRLSETVEGEAVRYLLAKLTSIRCKVSDVIDERDELLKAAKRLMKADAPAFNVLTSQCVSTPLERNELDADISELGKARNQAKAAIFNAERGQK